MNAKFNSSEMAPFFYNAQIHPKKDVLNGYAIYSPKS